MSVQRQQSPQWFGAMVSAYGIQAAKPEDKAAAVHTWAERTNAALKGQSSAAEKKDEAA